jgi:hypothetical protein
MSEDCENKWLWAGVWEKREDLWEVVTEEIEPRRSGRSGTACDRGGRVVAVMEAAVSTRLGRLWQRAWFAQAQAHDGNGHLCCAVVLPPAESVCDRSSSLAVCSLVV